MVSARAGGESSGSNAVRVPIHSTLHRWVAVALASHFAVEIVNAALSDPLGGYHRWVEGGGNGNYRTTGAWFFAVVGLWLYVGAPALAIRALSLAFETRRDGARRPPGREALGHRPIDLVVLAAMLVGVFVRIVDLGLLTGTLAVG